MDLQQKTILIVDDDKNATLLAEYLLKKEGFNICKASDGVEGFEQVYAVLPDLVLLDIDMPRMNGLELCQKIRADHRFSHLPIIMLTGSNEEDMLTKALASGSDDYLVKPYKQAELLARVKGIMDRNARILDANPLTKLPGNVAIINEIEKRIGEQSIFNVLYIDINKFKSFNDKYGFIRGDIVIKLTSKILIDAVSADDNKSGDFLGHIGGDDFIVITTPDKSISTCNYIIENFDMQVPSLYDDEDRLRGFIICKDRSGNSNEFPIMSISIGVVSNTNTKITHSGQVSSIGAELKKYSKTFPGSNYKIDRRDL